MEEIVLQVSNLVNFTEAAKILDVSRPTIYDLIKKQRLHPIVIGHNRYLLRNELDKLREINDSSNDKG